MKTTERDGTSHGSFPRTVRTVTHADPCSPRLGLLTCRLTLVGLLIALEGISSVVLGCLRGCLCMVNVTVSLFVQWCAFQWKGILGLDTDRSILSRRLAGFEKHALLSWTMAECCY